MAKYQTSIPEKAELARKNLERHIKQGNYIEQTKIDLKSLSLNGYFHILIPYFALRLTMSYNWTRETLIKQVICPDIFTEKRHNRTTGEEYDHPLGWRDLNSHKAHQVVQRVINYASIEYSIRLPDPSDLVYPEIRIEILQEIEEAKEFLY